MLLKVTKFEGNWPKDKKLQAKKQIGGWKTPPPVFIGLSEILAFLPQALTKYF